MAEAATVPAMKDDAAKDDQDRRREEIAAKVAALKLGQKKEEEQKTMYFGEHPSITCDGCGCVPMIGCTPSPAITQLTLCMPCFECIDLVAYVTARPLPMPVVWYQSSRNTSFKEFKALPNYRSDLEHVVTANLLIAILSNPPCVRPVQVQAVSKPRCVRVMLR